MVQGLSCVKPERSLPWGAPRELCKRHQLEVREGVQLQLQGVGDEGAGHLGRGWPAGASGSSSLCTQPGGAAGPQPPQEGDADLRVTGAAEPHPVPWAGGSLSVPPLTSNASVPLTGIRENANPDLARHTCSQ